MRNQEIASDNNPPTKDPQIMNKMSLIISFFSQGQIEKKKKKPVFVLQNSKMQSVVERLLAEFRSAASRKLNKLRDVCVKRKRKREREKKKRNL